jgi:CMP-N-acetylneuraminic acid synthetase
MSLLTTGPGHPKITEQTLRQNWPGQRKGLSMSTGEAKEFIALVPMRHHSERVPGKNYRELAGKPLYAYIMETLGACPEVGQIVVDTDSEIIQAGLERSFPDVRVIERPEHLRDGSVPMNDIIRNDLEAVPGEFFVQTHSTNPLLTSGTISGAIRQFRENSSYDSLYSVTRRQVRLWDVDGHPVNHDPSDLVRTQDLEPVFEENSCLYLFSRGSFLKRNNRLGERPQMFEIDPREAYDIDEEWDFQVVEAIMRRAREA